MNRRIISGLLCLGLMAALTGCGSRIPTETVPETAVELATAATEAVTPEAETTCPHTPTELLEAASETVSTEPGDAVSGEIDLSAPLKEPPAAGDYPEGITEEMILDYLGTVIFMGDSTSYSLYQWEMRNRQLGDALFLVRGGVSINSLISGYRKYFHNGAEKLAEDAVRDATENQGKQRLYIMLGLNDVPQFGAERSMELMETYLDHILAKSPELEIYLESLTMVRTTDQYPGMTNEALDRYNGLLKQYAEGHEGVHYVELAEYFKDHTNGLAEAYSYDKIHANDDGVEVWVRLLKRYIAEELAVGIQE